MLVSHRVGRKTSVAMRVPALAVTGLATWMLPFVFTWWMVRFSVVVTYWMLRLCWLAAAALIAGCTTLSHRHASHSPRRTIHVR